MEQNTLIDPDDAVNPLSEDLVEGLDDGGNREVADYDVGEPIHDDSNDIMEVLEGSDFEETECQEKITPPSRGTKIVYLFTAG